MRVRRKSEIAEAVQCKDGFWHLTEDGESKSMSEEYFRAHYEPVPEPPARMWTLEQIKAALLSIGKDAGNYDGHPKPHCRTCARDEACVIAAADTIYEYLTHGHRTFELLTGEPQC